MLEVAASPEPVGRRELALRSPALAHEVGMVGIREAVRLRPQLGDERLLLEPEDGLRRPCGGQERLDRLSALRISDGMTRAIRDAEPHAVGRGDGAYEGGAREGR
jgi:hypothetical protein